MINTVDAIVGQVVYDLTSGSHLEKTLEISKRLQQERFRRNKKCKNVLKTHNIFTGNQKE